MSIKDIFSTIRQNKHEQKELTNRIPQYHGAANNQKNRNQNKKV